MFSKANLPTGTFSGYLTGSPMRITNFCHNPQRLYSGQKPRGSVTHDDNTVISRWHSCKAAIFIPANRPVDLQETLKRAAESLDQS